MSKVKLKELKKGLLQVKEADLADHLANPDKKKAGSRHGKNENGEKKLLEEDYELNEALNLLKGIAVFSKR